MIPGVRPGMRRVLAGTRVIVVAAGGAGMAVFEASGRWTYMVTVTTATTIRIPIGLIVVNAITNGGIAFVIATPNISAAGNAAA